jgi:hypothetical protein
LKRDVSDKETNHRYKRDDNCSPPDNYVNKLTESLNTHIFSGDDNPSISLTWSGTNGVILALTTQSFSLFLSPSKLYRSTDRGKTFTDVSSKIGSATVIQKVSGVQVSPKDSANIILIEADSEITYDHNTKIHVTQDAGDTFQKVELPFHMDPSSIKFSAVDTNRLLAKSTNDHTLYCTHDFGKNWHKVSSFVVSASWDPLDAHILYYTFDPKGLMEGKI